MTAAFESPVSGLRATETSARRFSARLHRGLETVVPCWRAFQRAGGATAYQHREWTTGIARHLLPKVKAEALVVEVFDAGTGATVMLLPLTFRRRYGIRLVESLGHGVADYFAPISAPDVHLEAAEAEAAWAMAKAALPAADLVHLRQMPQTVSLGLSPRSNPLALLRAARTMSLFASGVRLGGDPATIVERLSTPQASREIASKRRRLAKRGVLRLVVPQTEAERITLFDLLISQRRDRFRELGRFDLLARPEVLAFYREAALAPDGPARLFGLMVDETCISAAYGLVHDGAFHGIILSMAGGEWRNVSAGILIIAELMRWSCAQGLQYFDFTVGAMSYKERFGAIPLQLTELIEALSPAGHLALAAVSAGRQLRQRVTAQDSLQQRLRVVRRTLRRFYIH